MSKRLTITAEYVRSILDYNPDTGIFVWRERPFKNFKTKKGWDFFNSLYAGKQAGGEKEDYIVIGLDRKIYPAHVLAWLYEYGIYPDLQVDHVNRIKTDNRISNLRLATNSQNKYNIGKRSTNTSGYKGVSLVKKTGKWFAKICVDGKQIGLGHFITPEEAHAAYCAAATKYHGEFARVE
jgi:hypothetical protein